MIYVEEQSIKLNGVVLPGVVKSIEVVSSAKIDEQEVEGSAAKPKQATGYEDAKVHVELILDDTPTQTKYQRFALLRSIFRAPGQTVPQPMPIVSADTSAHGVSRVLFKGITHKSENKRNQLPVTLEFWEYIPQTITAQKVSSKTGSSTSASTLTQNYTNYLANDRGVTNSTMQKSPAVDNQMPVMTLDRLAQLPF